MGRPLLFLDVDGPLIPFGGTYPHTPAWQGSGNPLLARINPELGRRLLALNCDLMWATSWLDEANEHISPLLGLPTLPVVDWPDSPEEPPGLHWKTPTLVNQAATRPFIWLDDEITAVDQAWVADHHHAPALLHRVNNRTGLTPNDFDTITTWLETLNATTEGSPAASRPDSDY